MAPPINYLAVLVAAILQMVLGYLWYGPLFGKSWAKLMGFTPERMKEAQAQGMGTSYGMMFVGAIIMAYILDHAVIFANAYMVTSGMGGGIIVGFMNWLGFIAPVTIGSVLWENKPWKLWYLNAGYYLAGLLIMGALLGAWQ